MKHGITSSFLWKIMLITLVVFQTNQARSEDIETYLSDNIVAFMSFSEVENQLQQLSKSKFFETLDYIHTQENPHDVNLEKKLQKLSQHPFTRLIAKKLVIGIAPPEESGKTTFVILSKGYQMKTSFEKLLLEEVENKKLYLLKEIEHQDSKIVYTIHPEKGKVEKRFTLVTDDFLIHSNDLEQVEQCYSRWQKKQKSFFVPPLNNVSNPFIRLYINFEGIKLNFERLRLQQKSVVEEDFRRFQKFFLGTKKLHGWVSIDKGVEITFLREKKANSDSALFRPLQIAQPDNNTIAFVTALVPYKTFWNRFKGKAKSRSITKWREFESKVNELFNWFSFEQDILPKIGPQTTILCRKKPWQRDQKLYLPTLIGLVNIDPEIKLDEAIQKLVRLVMKSPKARKHLLTRSKVLYNTTLRYIQFRDTPFDEYVTPGYATFGNFFIFGLDSESIEQVIKSLNNESQRGEYLYTYLNFPAIAQLVELNISFLREEAKNKNKNFDEKKLIHLIQLLKSFQYLKIIGDDQADKDVLKISLK